MPAPSRPGCLEVDALLAYLQDRSDEANRARVDQHIAECGTCRATLSALARDSAIISGPTLRPDVPPAGTSSDATLPAHLADEPLLPGGTRVGRYVVLGMEGAGGMGVVYAAEDPELRRKVAIKLLRPRPDPDTSGALLEERMRREAQALAKLSHPNVVTVHDVGLFGKRIFVAMEHVAGQTLARWLRDEPRAWREVLARFAAAGRGLAAAHAAGLVHRDFKPENVLLGNDGRPRVADFGLARSPSLAPPAPSRPGSPLLSWTLTAPGAMVGTPFYMSPEQLRGHEVDARSDQFSFCVGLYVGLYGEQPFAGDSIETLAGSIERGEVREVPPGTRVPPRIRRALLRGLSLAPEDRFPSMDALIEALEREPRRRWPIAAAAAAVVVLGAGTAVGNHLLGGESGPCRGSQSRMQGVWDAERRAGVARALRATGVPFADAAVGQVERQLDAYARGWVGMHTEACVATRVEGHQTEDQLGLRTTCLNGRLQELRALVDRLLEADEEVASNSASAAGKLSSLDTCADLEALAAPVRPPADPARRAQVDALQASLARARSFEIAGPYQKGLDVARPLVARARAIGHRPLEADVLLVVGELQEDVAAYEEAWESFEHAVWAAEAGRHDRTAARALVALIRTATRLQAHLDQVPSLESRVTAALERLGGDPELEADLRRIVGVFAYQAGKIDDAERGFMQALSLAERHFGVNHHKLVRPLQALVAVAEHRGQGERALEFARRMLSLQLRALGPEHPEVAVAYSSIADAERLRGRHGQSEAACRRALAIRERAHGPEHPTVSTELSCLGKALGLQGKHTQALAAFRRAAAIVEKALGPDHPSTARGLNELAFQLVVMERPREALPIVERMHSIMSRHHKGDHPNVADALWTMAKLKLQLGRADEALEAAAACDAMQKRLFGAGYQREANLLRIMGEAYLAKGQAHRAVAPLSRARLLYQRKFSNPAYLHIANSLLAMALYDSGRDRKRGRALAAESRGPLERDERTREESRQLERWMRKRGLP
jgi:eukaryotic-like serine/threonine-protein kinase